MHGLSLSTYTHTAGEFVMRPHTTGSSRKQLLLNHLVLSNPGACDAKKGIKLVIGVRNVCMPIFCAHWCISRAQLYRYIRMVEDGYPHLCNISEDRAPRDSRKRDFIVTWFWQYSAEVTEKLPDCDKLLLPRMLWIDLFDMFREDMLAAGYSAEKDDCV